MFGMPANNSRRGNNHFQVNGKPNKNNSKGNNRSKSRGQVDNKNNSLNRSKSRKRQEGGKFSEKKGKNNYNNKSGEKIVNKDKNTKKSNLKNGGKKAKPQKPIVDNEENFPSLLPTGSENAENNRHTRKSSADKRNNAEASPVKKEVTIKVDGDQKRERVVSESRDKIRER